MVDGRLCGTRAGLTWPKVSQAKVEQGTRAGQIGPKVSLAKEELEMKAGLTWPKVGLATVSEAQVGLTRPNVSLARASKSEARIGLTWSKVSLAGMALSWPSSEHKCGLCVGQTLGYTTDTGNELVTIGIRAPVIGPLTTVLPKTKDKQLVGQDGGAMTMSADLAMTASADLAMVE